MKFKYYPETDTFYIELKEVPSVESEEIADGVVLDYDENGEIVGRVKDTMISGNVYKVLSQVEQVSDSAEWVFGSMRSPALKCLRVEVAAKDE